MLTFLRNLLKDTGEQKKAAARKTDAGADLQNSKEDKLRELRLRLTEMHRRAPLQVLGNAFLVEIVPEDPNGTDRTDWDDAMSKSRSLLDELTGSTGIVRRVGAVDYFVRFPKPFHDLGNMNCEWMFGRLEQELAKSKSGKWTIQLSAALPGSDGDIHFVLVKKMEDLRSVLESLIDQHAPDSGEATPDADPGEEASKTTAEAPSAANGGHFGKPGYVKHSPGWRPDELWERIGKITEWQENLLSAAHTDLDIEIPAPDPENAIDAAPEPKPGRSAEDRVREAEAEVITMIDSIIVRFQPLWDINAKQVAGIFAVPALVRNNLVVRTGDDMFGRGVSAGTSAALDRKVLDHTWKQVGLVNPETRMRVILPLHFRSLESSTESQILSAALRPISEKRSVHRSIVLVIVNVPPQAPLARLNSHAQSLRSYADEIWVELPSAQTDFSPLNKASVSRVGFEIAKTAQEDALMDDALSFATRADKKGMTTFARGHFTKNIALALPTIGIVHLSGRERFADPASAVAGDKRFDLEAFLAI